MLLYSQNLIAVIGQLRIEKQAFLQRLQCYAALWPNGIAARKIKTGQYG